MVVCDIGELARLATVMQEEENCSILVGLLKEQGGTVQDGPAEALAIYATLITAQVRSLAKSDSVGRVFLDGRTGIPDLANSEAVSRATQAQALRYTGVGVHVAVFEGGPENLKDLEYAGRYVSSPEASDYARLTSAIIKNTEPGKPNGYALQCSLYSASSWDNAALQWAIDSPQSCTVISQSFHRGSEGAQDGEGSSSLSADDILKDHIATQWPYSTIVHAAGNIFQVIEYVNYKGFNTLSVSGHDDNATAMAGDWVFKNPASPTGDRELLSLPRMALQLLLLG